MNAVRSFARARGLAYIVAAAATMNCESGGGVTAPRATEAFARFVVIGGDLSMGVQSGGIVNSSQAVSWPTVLTAAVGVEFHQPLFRSPGCTPPLVAPLMLGRRLSGTATTTRDSSCAGALASELPPGANLALAGATAWAALTYTPKALAAAPGSYEASDRLRYPIVLGNTQSQVTAMMVKSPTFVAIELGSSEVINALLTGQVIVASSYLQVGAWTFAPPSLFAPVFASVTDSAAKLAVKAVVLSVPHLTRLPAFRTGAALWADRVALTSYGVSIDANCNGSANLVHAAGRVTALALRALATGQLQPLSCANIPNAADQILEPGDVATLDAAVDQMNARISQVAQAHGWAYVNVDEPFGTMIAAAGAFNTRFHLTCTSPYGSYFSLDGIRPNARGHALLANAVATAINERYGFDIPLFGESLEVRPAPCQ